jgi:cobalt-zinc-cadmium efflux system protein
MHEHDHLDKENLKGKKILATLVLNAFITIAEIVGGLYSSSLALLSDALHSLSDIFAVLISYLGFRLAQLENSEKRTYGLRRAEVLAALINAVLLAFLSLFLFREAYLRFFEPEAIKTGIVAVVGVIGLLANLGSMLLLYEKGRKTLNLYSAFLHMLADALSSVAVIVAAIIISFTGYYFLDPALSLLIGIYVLYQSYKLLSESLRILMHIVPRNIDLNEIKQEVEKLDGISNIHHMHVWSLTDKEIFFEGHVESDQDLRLSEACRKMSEIEALLREKFGINHTTIQFEFDACKDKSLIKKRKS